MRMYTGNFTFISQEQPPYTVHTHIPFIFLVSENVCMCTVCRHMYYLFILMCIVQRGQILHIARVPFRNRIDTVILVLLFMFIVQSPMKRNDCFEPCMG